MTDVRRAPRRWRPVLALILLAPLVGEYLLGNTPITELGALPLFVPLYGCGALLIREAARHTGRGWPTMLLLGAAYGLFEEGPVDQMLWNSTYGGIDLGLTYGGTHLSLLGTSVSLVEDVVSIHMIWSICVPIAIVEAFRSDRRQPWLGRTGLVVTALVFVTGSASLAVIQYASNHHFVASAWQWTVGCTAIAVLIVVAFRLVRPHGPRPEARRPDAAPSPWRVGFAAFVITSGYWAGQSALRDHVSDWALAVAWLVLAACTVVGGVRWSRRHGWGERHRTALAVGALLTYVWVGFTQASDIGVSTATALTGNVIFATGAVILSIATVRTVNRRRRSADKAQEQAATEPSGWSPTGRGRSTS